MERRDLLKAGVAVAASTGAGCATVASGAGAASRDVGELVATLRADLRLIEDYAAETRLKRVPVPHATTAAGKPLHLDLRAVPDADVTWATRAMKSLYVTGTFHQLTRDEQLHPAAQALLVESLPDMDESLLQTRDFLASRSDAELLRVQTALRERPELAQGVFELFEDAGRVTAVDVERRKKLRTVLAQNLWRMEKQSVRTVVDEHVAKMDRVVASAGGSAETQRAAVTQAMRAALAQQATVEGDEPVPAPKATGGGVNFASVGAKMMGFGAITFAGGALLILVGGVADAAPLAWVGAAATTLGGLAVIIGLFVWIIGLLIDDSEPVAETK